MRTEFLAISKVRILSGVLEHPAQLQNRRVACRLDSVNDRQTALFSITMGMAHEGHASRIAALCRPPTLLFPPRIACINISGQVNLKQLFPC